jgi:uncharacterized CHY-type Zn-finger protein
MVLKSYMVQCTVELLNEADEQGNSIKRTKITCGKCGKRICAKGHSPQVKKCILKAFNKRCPKGERNYYIRERE